MRRHCHAAFASTPDLSTQTGGADLGTIERAREFIETHLRSDERTRIWAIVDDGTAYYGNALVHRNDFTLDETTWVCLEVHARINPDPASSAGAVLEVWKNDVLMRRFDDTGQMGWWIRDKFCPGDSDGTECTDYPAPPNEILDLQYRNTSALRLNAFWPQNYITDDAMGSLAFDQMVVATRRVGCLR